MITTSGNRKQCYLGESSCKQSSVFHWHLFLMSHSNLKSVQPKLYSLMFFPKTPFPCISNFVVLQIFAVLRAKNLKSHSILLFFPPKFNHQLSSNSSIPDPLPLTDFDYQFYYYSIEPVPGQLHEHETSTALRTCSQRVLYMRFNAPWLPSQNSWFIFGFAFRNWSPMGQWACARHRPTSCCLPGMESILPTSPPLEPQPAFPLCLT